MRFSIKVRHYSFPDIADGIMVTILENHFFQLIIDSDSSCWSVFSKDIDGVFIENVGMGVAYRTRLHRPVMFKPLLYEDVYVQQLDDPKHGHVTTASVETRPDSSVVATTITFTLPEDYPVLLWKLGIENRGDNPVFIYRLELLDAGQSMQQKRFIGLNRSRPTKRVSTRKSAVRLSPRLGDLAFYANGWGSWNFSAVYGHRERSRRSRLGPFTQPIRKNQGTPQLRGRGKFAGDMFGIIGDREHRTGILLGFLSQRQHFGSVKASTQTLNPALRLWSNGDDTRLDPERSMQTDWACVQMLPLDNHTPLDPYLNAVAREHQIPAWDEENKSIDIPVGWCSWYHFFQEITAQDVRANLASIQELKADLPIELIQIDDGYQSQVGDWLEFSPGFPDGVAPLAAEIRAAGRVPGIWLAPFIVHPGSRLAREKRDWLLRNNWGLPVTAGFIWNRFTRALDLTNPGAMDYVQEVIHTAVHDWGYPYMKLDFLYAAALPGRYRDSTRTRAQVLRGALERIRQTAGPHTTLLGCGCPLGSALGIVDAMRIGADVAPNWSPKYGGLSFIFKQEPDFPAVQNALQNVLTRAFMHKKWWVNDPDCLLMRTDSELSLDEVCTLATVIALSGGALLVSDHLPLVNPERIRLTKSLLPLIGQRPIVLDWFDAQTPSYLRIDLKNVLGEWHLLAFINWGNRENEVKLRAEEFHLDPESAYASREFWSGNTHIARDDLIASMSVPAHGSALLAVRKYDNQQPKYVGSDLHVSQGLEVTRWQAGSTRLTMDLERPGQSVGSIDLYLPNTPREVLLDNQPVPYSHVGQGVYRFDVDFEENASIHLYW